jgi:hypothetical protein
VILGLCGPFTDVSDVTFCPFVLEIFYLGITTGTSPTTYDPAATVNRLQMAAFLSRSVDRTLQRGGRRAALKQFWTPQNNFSIGLTTVGTEPSLVESDGADLWVANNTAGTVSRVRGSDGKLLETWTGAAGAFGVLTAIGRVFVTENAESQPGKLYVIDPTQPAGTVSAVTVNLGSQAAGVAFDGTRIWTANNIGSVSIVTPGAAFPWTVTTVTTGFNAPVGALFDGNNIWVTDSVAGSVLKLGPTGAILQTVTVGSTPAFPVFDGTSIWVPNLISNSVSVVRASNGSALATLTGNNLDGPTAAAFDGQRILVTNQSDHSVSLWKAADLTPLGFFPAGAAVKPFGACSDGINFWITLNASGKLARF